MRWWKNREQNWPDCSHVANIVLNTIDLDIAQCDFFSNEWSLTREAYYEIY